jgi:hypothetical protein
MMADYWDEPDYDPDVVESEEVQPRDRVVDEAGDELESFFATNSESVYYQRQLQVIFEGKYFHWITAHALLELAAEGRIASESLPLPGTGTITMYRAVGHRYWRRQAEEIIELVSRFSDPAFTAALGAHGELMFDAALPGGGFMPAGRKVRSYGGRTWTETGHDLDRIFERDGIAYGTEIKNSLSYMDRGELGVKLRMCSHLGVRPLFIVRMAPKNYINEVGKQGGFTLVFKYQLYPFGQKAFADAVRARLGLWTDCPARIGEGTVQRFLKWHLRKLKGEAEDELCEL